MSAEYSVEEVREMASVLLHNPKPREWKTRAGKMLTAYANRIEADEMAVPVAKIRHFNYHGIARNRFSQEAQMLDGVQELPEGTELFTRPPAQAAQVGVVDQVEMHKAYRTIERWFRTTMSEESCEEYLVELDRVLAYHTHPHSPDAADSGRVDAVTDYYTGRNRGGWAAPRNKTASEAAALAAQGQGEAVAEVYEYPRDHHEPVPRMLTGIRFTGMPLPIGTKLYAAPSATPEGGEVQP